MSYATIATLVDAGYRVKEILDHLGVPMFGYKSDKPGLGFGQFLKKSEAVPRKIPVGMANPYPSPKKTPKKRPAPVAIPTKSKKPKIPVGEAVPRKIPVGVANPGPSKKQKKNMPKAKGKRIEGDRDEVIVGYSTLKLNSKPAKISKKADELGKYMHVHNYAWKVNSGTLQNSGYQAVTCGKMSIGMENFTNTIGYFSNIQARLTGLNTRVEQLDPNVLVARRPVDQTGEMTTGFNPYEMRHSYYHMKSQLVSIHLKNMLNLPARVTCYWVTPKQNTRVNPVQVLYETVPNQDYIDQLTLGANTDPTSVGTTFGDIITPTNTLTSGIVNSGNGLSNNTMYMMRGYKPTDFPEFKKRFKFLKKDVINLPSGGLVVHNVRLVYNKLFSERYATLECQAQPPPETGTLLTSTGPLAYKQQSVYPLFVIEGYLSQADRGTAIDTPTFGNFNINIGIETKSQVNWVQQQNVQPQVTFRGGTLMGATVASEEFINIIDQDDNGEPAV